MERPENAAPSRGLQEPEAGPTLLRHAHLLPALLAEIQPILRAMDRDLARRHSLLESQWLGLEALERKGPLSVTGLGEALGLEKSTASRLADSLIADDLVRKRPSLTDGRSVVVQLTGRGVRKAREVLNDRTGVWLGVLAGSSTVELRDTPTLLGELAAALTRRNL